MSDNTPNLLWRLGAVASAFTGGVCPLDRSNGRKYCISASMTKHLEGPDNMTHVISLNPFQCRMWKGHERLEEHINEVTCRGEIESVLAHGQLIPVLGRTLKRDIDHSHELVYGARRLFIARHLNLPLLAEVRDLSDRDAIIALDIENRQRKALSPYERGCGYNSWLRGGMISSQEELARVLNISASQVSRLLRLAQLPTVIISAFSSPTEICESWGRDLMEIWEDPERRSQLTASARAIVQESPKVGAAPAIYQRLMANSPQKAKGERVAVIGDHDEVIKNELGEPLFRVRVHLKDVALLLPASALSGAILSEIKTQVSGILQRGRAQLHEGQEYRLSKVKRAEPIAALQVNLDEMRELRRGTIAA